MSQPWWGELVCEMLVYLHYMTQLSDGEDCIEFICCESYKAYILFDSWYAKCSRLSSKHFGFPLPVVILPLLHTYLPSWSRAVAHRYQGTQPHETSALDNIFVLQVCQHFMLHVWVMHRNCLFCSRQGFTHPAQYSSMRLTHCAHNAGLTRNMKHRGVLRQSCWYRWMASIQTGDCIKTSVLLSMGHWGNSLYIRYVTGKVWK
jgi:hypothetical protein